MRLNFSSPLFLFILLFSPFTTGNFQNAIALTPVADLTGDWSGFAQVSFANGNCETTGNVNAHLTQHENDIEGEYSFVPTSVKTNLEGAECDASFLAIQQAIHGTLDGSRITLYSEGATFSGWYASSGIRLDIQADEISGTTQLSPTGFTPPAFAPKDTDGDGIPDSKDACPNEPAPGTVDGCPEKNTQEKADQEKAAAEQAAVAEAKAAQEKAAAEQAAVAEAKAAQEKAAAEQAAEEENSKSAKLLRQMENEPEPKDWAEAGESTVNGNSEQILQNQKVRNLQVYKGSATITTADGTVVDSNELKIGQTIQTGTNSDTNVKIGLENGGVINLKENTKLSTVGISLQEDQDLSFLFDKVEELKQKSTKTSVSDQDLSFLFDKVEELKQKSTKTSVSDQDLSFLFDKVEELKQKSSVNQVYEELRPVLDKVGLSDEKTNLLASSFFAGGLLGLIPSGGTSAVLIATGYLLIVGSMYYDYTSTQTSNDENHNNVIFTPHAALVPHGTEFTVSVEDGVTKLNVLQGEVSVVPYDTSHSITAISAGGSILVSDNKVEKTKLDTAAIDRWWDKALTLEQGQQSSAPQATSEKKGGGCLIATAAFGSELAPQIQQLRETRDSVLFHTASGSAFMTAFNQVYYTFSPTVADWERENPLFKEAVKITITPLITTLSILNYVQIHSEAEMLSYGIGIILLNIGMYFVAPAVVILRLKQNKKSRARMMIP